LDYVLELKELLRPLKVFELDTGLGAALINCVGAELNTLWAKLELIERESNPMTAQTDGLTKWEELLPFVPASRSLTERRNAIAALLQIDGAGFTVSALNSTLSGCGIPAVVRETASAQTVEVVFPGTRGIPAQFTALEKGIEQILPCHLGIQYVFAFLLWQEFMALFSDWNALEAEETEWESMERLGETEP